MEALTNFLFNTNLVSLFIKLFGVVGGFLYLFFSVIMIRQVDTMKKTVTVNDKGLLVILTYTQVGLASLVLFYALFIL